MTSCFSMPVLGIWKLLSALMLRPSVEALSSSTGSSFPGLCIKYGFVEPEVGLLFLSTFLF